MENDRFHVVDFHQYVRCDDIEKIIAQRDELLAALNNLVDIIDKAGLGNLSKGVQLGAMSWYVKASDAVEWAREAIAKCEVKS